MDDGVKWQRKMSLEYESCDNFERVVAITLIVFSSTHPPRFEVGLEEENRQGSILVFSPSHQLGKDAR